MKNHIVDNSLKNLGKTVLWQYDKAYRLLSVLKHFQMMYHISVEEFWNFWIEKVLNIETCGAFGASIWGIFLGIPRPTVKDAGSGKSHLVATSVYRRILKGSFYLMKASGSFSDILGYLEIVFGVSGNDSLSPWVLEISEYGWTAELEDDYNKKIYYLDENGETKIEDAENLRGDMVFLKVKDPEGKVRKIGGAAYNSLIVTVTFMYGETRITATATRRKKCGLRLIDNGDMSMTVEKSQYWDEMHKDQKALFEQRRDEYIPFPIGIGTNEPVQNWVFGLVDDNYPDIEGIPFYQPNIEYKAGEKVKCHSMVDEIEKIKREGAYVVLELTGNYTPDATLDEEQQYINTAIFLFWNSRVISRYMTSSQVPSSIGEFVIGDNRPFSVGDKVFVNFAWENWYSGKKRKSIQIITVSVTIPSSLNAFFGPFYICQMLTAPIMKVSQEDVGNQRNVQYAAGKAYEVGDMFGYVDEEGNCYNWKCKENITGQENVSFNAIKSKIEKTSDGGPFVTTLSEDHKPYVDFRRMARSIEYLLSKNSLNNKLCFDSISRDQLFVGKSGNVYKIYKNNSGREFIIAHNLETGEYIKQALGDGYNYYLIVVEEFSIESLMVAANTLAVEYNCPEVKALDAEQFMPDVYYRDGDVVIVNGEEYIVCVPGKWSSLEKAVPYLVRQPMCGIHEFYDYDFSPYYDREDDYGR